MVATSPMPTFTESLDSSVKWVWGNLGRRYMPSKAPPKTQAKTNAPMTHSCTPVPSAECLSWRDMRRFDNRREAERQRPSCGLTVAWLWPLALPASAVESPDPQRLGVAPDGHGAERCRGDAASSRRHHSVGYDQPGGMLFRELLQARRQIDRVADGGELLAPRRPDIAGDRRADMQADAHFQRERAVGETAAVDLRQHLARGGDAMARGGGIFQRRAEDGHEAIAEKLVD